MMWASDEIIPVSRVLVGGSPVVAQVFVTSTDGKNVPGKYTIQTGSELMIIEPEYIEWTGTQELYPFIFQSLGDWGVSTAIAPPEGFVADYPSLATDVNSTTASIQFTVIDVGSDWVDTKVVHTLKHKNQKLTVKSSIGVKNKKKKGKKK